MNVEFINDTTWQGKQHKAKATANLPDDEARALIFYGAARPAKGTTSQASRKAVEVAAAQSEPTPTENPKG